MIYLGNQKYLYIAQKGPEHEKVDKQMSINTIKYHETQIS